MDDEGGRCKSSRTAVEEPAKLRPTGHGQGQGCRTTLPRKRVRVDGRMPVHPTVAIGGDEEGKADRGNVSLETRQA